MAAQEHQHRFAINEVPEGLFKFRAYGAEDPGRDRKQKDRVHRLIRDGLAYFASPSQFNDPFEARPKFASTLSRRKLGDHLARFVNRRGKAEGIPLRKRIDAMERIRGRDPDALLRGLQAKHRARMRAECAVFCMTADRTSLLQWSHYAAGHSGICIGFGVDNDPIGGALAVEYRDEYPVAHFPVDHKQLLRTTILTKATTYSYEREYRLVSVRMGNPTWHLGLAWEPDQRTAHLNPKRIVGVTLGARMSENDQAEMIDFCRRYRPDIVLERARTSDDEFKLEFERI